ncbi:Asp-tRNA(Asn)/Glu-tRNA(Gln) amidotransferase subunit GatC [Candidatus Wolfebacteria bacterium]|nr:Asp-tRNA(Asn)/Glu-tRNA(Gln) amidotransferase subunit GatC [Candidatus Wolfebacteria bacterium]
MMKKIIDKEILKHLTELARIELESGKEEKLLKDMEKILEYFEELKSVNTESIEPMAGGTIQKNIFREDSLNIKIPMLAEKLVKQFPEKENGFLKVPGVFE